MKKSEWSDKQLEDLLRQMPKIHDHRDPRDIYQNLSIKKRRVKAWIVPGIAAAFLLMLILVPNVLNGLQLSTDNANKSNISSRNIELSPMKKNATVLLKKSSTPLQHFDETGTAKGSLMRLNNVKTAVYQDDIQNGKVITYWVPDPEGQILIPVSKIITNVKDKSWITLFNENMTTLREEEWGLSEYYPVNARLTYNKTENSVNVDVPANHHYGQGAANETNFVNAIRQDISTNSNAKIIKLSTEGQPGINLGNFGVLSKIPIFTETRRAYFRFIPKRRNKPFLVPTQDRYKDIQSALEAMKKDKKDLGLKASLLPSFQIKNAFIKNRSLNVTLKENLMMKDDANTLYCLEALLLTAKEFGANTVRMTNAPIVRIGPFDLTKPIQVPVAPNLR